MATTPQVSARMAVQARRDTAPELAVRQALHARGYRFRVDWPLPGMRRRRADIAFTRRQVVVFIDGCFWHSCPIHATSPVRNGAWWADKLAGNVRRDRDTDERMEEQGWAVLRFWEHEPVAEILPRILGAVGTPKIDRFGSRFEQIGQS